MTEKRKVELFSAGCPICREAVEEVKNLACTSCEITVLDVNDPAVAARAKSLGVKSVPAVAIGGRLLSCCSGRGIDLEELKKTCTAG